MCYCITLPSPLGDLTLVSDGAALTGLWLAGQRHVPDLEKATVDASLPVFHETAAWLARYFAGYDPGPTPPLAPLGTPFQLAVWQQLRQIPYGKTTTYGRLAAQLAAETGRRTSARAVGQAVGRNPISILIPCHRVIGAGGALTGYAGGLDRKRWLLALEGTLPKA